MFRRKRKQEKELGFGKGSSWEGHHERTEQKAQIAESGSGIMIRNLYTLQQVEEMVEGIENPYELMSRYLLDIAYEDGDIERVSEGYCQRGFDEAIQTIKTRLQEMEGKGEKEI